jgi:hypothetical protein
VCCCGGVRGRVPAAPAHRRRARGARWLVGAGAGAINAAGGGCTKAGIHHVAVSLGRPRGFMCCAQHATAARRDSPHLSMRAGRACHRRPDHGVSVAKRWSVHIRCKCKGQTVRGAATRPELPRRKSVTRRHASHPTRQVAASQVAASCCASTAPHERTKMHSHAAAPRGAHGHAAAAHAHARVQWLSLAASS